VETLGIEIVIQICRMQIQRERERLMTPKLRGVAAALAKLKSAVEDDASKLLTRIEDAGKQAESAFTGSHGVLDVMNKDVQDIENFVRDLAGHNGGDPLGGSDGTSNIIAHPRSSEVAQR
jgi:hypothetical protein